MWTFHDSEEFECYHASGVNSNFQLCDSEVLIIGGSSGVHHDPKEDRPAIIITDNFKQGFSSKSETFANEVLCGNGDSQ